MYFYFIDGYVTSSSIELNAGNGFGRAVSISEAQYNFGIANTTASYSEVIAMELEPVPEPQPTELTPTLEDEVASISDALAALIEQNAEELL